MSFEERKRHIHKTWLIMNLNHIKFQLLIWFAYFLLITAQWEKPALHIGGKGNNRAAERSRETKRGNKEDYMLLAL